MGKAPSPSPDFPDPQPLIGNLELVQHKNFSLLEEIYSTAHLAKENFATERKMFVMLNDRLFGCFMTPASKNH